MFVKTGVGVRVSAAGVAAFSRVSYVKRYCITFNKSRRVKNTKGVLLAGNLKTKI